jgi:Protein kinase domain
MTEDDTIPEPRREKRAPLDGGGSDRYRPGPELGRGGMGRVVEAHDQVLGRTVALKEVTYVGEEGLRRFARETQITARLEHPSIVPVYDAGVSPRGAPFYVMRKVTGRPLDKLVAGAASLDERLALIPNVLAATQAIAHAHERGIIHRDLKPSNILVGAHGETIVIDWGLAKATGESEPRKPARVEPIAGDSLQTLAGDVFGTPGFMSPEQHASSADVDERADVYALGATLYYVLSTKIPPAEGPVPPLALVVTGVPRELQAIVDKALAADLAVRYRDAGRLAEDLARFTTGQLVAAHDYRAGERLARFVRRHRALVITIAIATVILAVGAWLAVGNVLLARDEAVAQANAAEAARARESERASDLVVSQAKLLLASNPTGALAMVRPLANTSRWREARAVAAGARASGIAYSLPGPSTVVFAELSHDGAHAVVAGADGSLHVHDLATRTHAVVTTLPGRIRATFAGDNQLIAWSGTSITVIDLATRATKTFERPAPVLRLDARDGVAYYVDDTKRAFRLNLATGEATSIPLPGPASFVAISPDGKRIALAGEHLWLIEANHPELVEQLHAGKKFELAWSPDGEHLATIGEHATYDITVHPETEIGEWSITNQTVAHARGMLYTMGLSGLTIGDRKLGAADLQSSMAGLHVTKGDFVVGAARTALRVFDGFHEYQVPLPATPMTLLRASPRSPYILAVCANLVLVWNVEDIMPRRITVPSYAQVVTLGRDQAWTITNAGPALAIDLATGKTSERARLPPVWLAAPAGGEYVIARSFGAQETLLVRPDGSTDVLVAETEFVAAFDNRRVVLATKRHEVVLLDVATRAREPIASFNARVERIVVRERAPRWLVVALEDGKLVRHDLETKQLTETRTAPRTEVLSPGMVVTAAARTGDVYFATGARIRRWSLRDVEDLTALPMPLMALHLLDEERLLAVTADGTGYLVHLPTGALARVQALGASYAWGAEDPTLVVTDDRTGGVTVLDTVANISWKVARAAPTGMTPDISGDGKFVVMRDASLEAGAIAIVPLDLPTTPEATARWIDGMTNATFDPRTGMLGWPAGESGRAKTSTP